MFKKFYFSSKSESTLSKKAKVASSAQFLKKIPE